MFENVRRAVLLILVPLVVSIIVIVLPEPSLRLGLDLAGGQRLVYELPIEEAKQQQLIEEDADNAQILEQFISITRERVDPQGVTEPVIRSMGSNRIEINIPGGSLGGSAAAAGRLAEPVLSEGTEDIQLAIEMRPAPETGEPEPTPESQSILDSFPASGGVVSIGGEKFRYSRRVGSQLVVDRRAFGGTPQSAHEANTSVQLVSSDQIKDRIENLGDLRFMIVANDGDFTSRGADRASEQSKLSDWWQRVENENAPISLFNSLPAQQGGPVDNIQWYPMRLAEGAEFMQPREREIIPVLVAADPDWRFSGQDIERVQPGQDDFGFPAVHIAMQAQRGLAMREFTEEYEGRQMAMILNGEVLSAPSIDEPFGDRFRISGRYTQDAVDEMVTVLRTGSLQIRPILISEERVGATLGQASVRSGYLSAAVGIAAVLGIMIIYYKGLGLMAAISLACNLTMLLGVMTFLQATLTLPGIAGIILTVGMAVDANILIFDRIREEAEKGRKALQSAQNGFKQAFSAIFDANVTTLITAAILYKVGSGPVRGFAVTLGWGIVTSLTAALVITRILVHYQLERGAKGFPMMRLLADANFNIIGKRKLAMTGSLVFIVLGLALFFAQPTAKKYGLDFLGGASVKVRTETPQTPDQIRSVLAESDGPAGSAEVQALPASAVGEGRFTEFRVTVKDVGAGAEAIGKEDELEGEVRAALGPVLQKGPLAIMSKSSSGGVQNVELDLYFEEAHQTGDVLAALVDAGYAEPTVTHRDSDRQDVFRVGLETAFGLDEAAIKERVLVAFTARRDSAGAQFKISNPVPEATIVGNQVVGDLKNSAVLALIVSLFAVVMYIRLRFAEYSFGIAAMVAVAHDVLVTLGVLAIAMQLGWVGIEINLPLIAAFLTIVGYSLNDTIVVFDRIRENRPRMKGTLSDIANRSINQTLSRTIMTSLTTLTTVLVLMAFNIGSGSVLESFAFALAIGVIVGTYSTLFIATPIFVWLEERAQRGAPPAAATERARKVPATAG